MLRVFPVLLLALCVLAVVAGTRAQVQSSRRELVDQFADDRQAHLDGAARRVAESFDDVADDLRLAVEVVGAPGTPAQVERELRPFLEAVNQYKAIGVASRAGGPGFVVVDRNAPAAQTTEALRAALRAAAAQGLLLAPGTLVVSPQLESDANGWLRIFSLSDESACVAVLVDTEPFFAPLSVVTSDPGAQVMVLGPHGRPTPSTDARISAALSSLSSSLLKEVASRSRTEAGRAVLGEAEARAVGIDGDALMVYRPIETRAGQWGAAILVPLEGVRAHERALMLRIAVGTLLVSAFLGAFAAYVVIARRRAVQLQQAREAAERLTRLNEQLVRAEKLATVGVLAAGIAHEIGTPLGIVRGRAELVGTRLEEPSQRDAMNIIVDQIDRVSRTLQQLLDFSRQKAPAAIEVSVRSAAQNVLELLRVEAERRRVLLQCDVPPETAPVKADPDQIQQVLVNLVLNAVHASEPGQAVRIRAENAGEVVRMSVEDEGCGIPAENLHRVFDPFFTTKKRGAGTGLGLTIAAQLVRNHGGDITLDSAPGAGTRVHVAWPSVRGAP